MASIADTYYTAQQPLRIVGAHVANSSIGEATTLTPPATAHALLIQALDENVRYTLDGTTPTASVGFQLKADGEPLLIDIGIGMTVKVIQETATATIQYQWGAFA